jgi:hypothetical protein
MSIVLTNQVEASEKSADALGRLALEHERAVSCREVEALMDLVAATFADINRYVERWQDEVADGRALFDEAFARGIFDIYVRLERAAHKTAQLGRTAEGWGYTLAGKARFLGAWRAMKGITSFDLDRVGESFAQIRRGDVQELGEFADERGSAHRR